MSQGQFPSYYFNIDFDSSVFRHVLGPTQLTLSPVSQVFIQIILFQSASLHVLDVHPAIRGTLAFVLTALPLICVPVGIFVTLCKVSHRQRFLHLHLHRHIVSLCLSSTLFAHAEPGRHDHAVQRPEPVSAAPARPQPVQAHHQSADGGRQGGRRGGREPDAGGDGQGVTAREDRSRGSEWELFNHENSVPNEAGV